MTEDKSNNNGKLNDVSDAEEKEFRKARQAYSDALDEEVRKQYQAIGIEPSDAQKESLKEALISRRITKAPPPINPLSGYVNIPPKASISKPLEPQKELFKPVTGTELMKKWSVGWEAIFDFARQEALIPYEPERFRTCIKYDFGLLSNIYPEKKREEYFSKWLYHPSDIETFSAIHKRIIDAWLQKATSSIESTNSKAEKQRNKVIPCSPGTQWEDIQIEITSHETAKITTTNGSETFSFHELGFKDIRKGDSPTKPWNTLQLFAKSEGRIDGKILKTLGQEDSKRFIDRTRILNKKFKQLFGIDDSIYLGHYKKHRAYITRFKIKDKRIFDESEEIEKSTFDDEMESVN